MNAECADLIRLICENLRSEAKRLYLRPTQSPGRIRRNPVGIYVNGVVIRLAALHNREALCRLYHAFHQFHVRALPDRLLSLGEPPETYEGSELYLALEKIIHDDDAAILLAEVNGQPVGLAEVYLRQDEANPLRAAYRYGYLQSLIVEEAFRQRGVGTRLVKAAHQWARDRGAAEMRLDTWEFEQGPVEFYERLGYRTLRRTLVRAL